MTPLGLINWAFEIAVCVVAGVMILSPIILIVSEAVAEIRSRRRPR